MMSKDEIREIIKMRARKSTRKKEIDRSKKIAKRILALGEVKSADAIMCYVSMEGEVHTHELIDELIARGKRVYVPRVRKRGVMDAIRIHAMDDLAPGTYGILEPREGNIIAPQALDVVIVPSVAIDAARNRLGHGAGYYDRYLENTRALRVAPVFEWQMVDYVPHEEHDILMNVVVSESRIIQYDERKYR